MSRSVRRLDAFVKTRRLIAITSSALAVAVVVCVAITAYWQRQPVLQNATKIVAGLQEFSRAQVARGRTLPASVSLRELVDGGYIGAEDVRVFDGMDVTISLTADETRPQEILIRVRMPDGHVMSALADGSAQQLRR